MKKFVVVTGLPASGKSVLGRTIAASLELPLIDKDTHLEFLFASRPCSGIETRQMLSREADESFRREVENAQGGVLVSWWRHPSSTSISGTPVDWLRSLSGSIIELRCVCGPSVAVERFIARNRHPGHQDSLRSASELIAQFEQQDLLGPLGVGNLVEVNSELAINFSSLLVQILAAFSSPKSATFAA